MQSIGSFSIIAAFLGVAALAIALGAIIGAPILAVPFFIVGFGAFLVSRGRKRAGTPSTAYERGRARVPDTEEAAGDPVGDSGVAEVTRSASAGGHRADAPHV
jgi:hypothetical protein